MPSAAFGLAAALAGLASCEPVQNPYGATKGTQLGSSSSFDSGSGMAAPSASGTVAGGTIDSPQSQGLSDYLKAHSLPLVGAQVVTSSSGGKQVILFGFVASDFGKTDAEQKARHYLKDPTLVVDNRIKISPELAGSDGSSHSTVNGVPSGNAMPYDNRTAPIPTLRPARSRIIRTTCRPARRLTRRRVSKCSRCSSISSTAAAPRRAC